MSGLNGIGGNYNFNVNGLGPKKIKTEETEQKAAEKQVAPQSKNVSADEVLSFLGGQSSAIIDKKEKHPAETISTKKTIQVSKYVDAESAKRIASSVLAFQGAIDNIKDQLSADDSEFKGLSDEAKTNLALAAFSNNFMED